MIFGEEDPNLSTRVARDFADSFPNSKLHIIGEAAHFVQLDKPGKVANPILGIGP